LRRLRVARVAKQLSMNKKCFWIKIRRQTFARVPGGERIKWRKSSVNKVPMPYTRAIAPAAAQIVRAAHHSKRDLSPGERRSIHQDLPGYGAGLPLRAHDEPHCRHPAKAIGRFGERRARAGNGLGHARRLCLDLPSGQGRRRNCHQPHDLWRGSQAIL